MEEEFEEYTMKKLRLDTKENGTVKDVEFGESSSELDANVNGSVQENGENSKETKTKKCSPEIVNCSQVAPLTIFHLRPKKGIDL